MQSHTSSVLNLSLLLALFLATLFSVSVLFAWTAPTQSAPAGNTVPPINIGNLDQVKNGALSLDALAVFGSALVSGSGGVSYINFGSSAGSDGYGFRNNNGTMQFKNQNGEWKNICNCGAEESPSGEQWTAWAYSPRSNEVYLSNDMTGPHTYGGSTFYVYNITKIFTGTWAEFSANPQAAVAAAQTIPIGYTRTPRTRFVFNFAQLESETPATQASVAAGITSFIENRFTCTQNVVNATQCHYNNQGTFFPGFSRSVQGAIYGTYSDNDSGASLTQYPYRMDFLVD